MKVCSHCGCPPPRKGEPGIYCSACGAEVVYKDDERKTVLLNTSILTDYGIFGYVPLSLEDARQIAARENFESAIGHESTAEILTEILGVSVTVNRSDNKQSPGDQAIVFKLRGRPEEGRVLSRADIDRIGFDFGLLTRIS
ncbi:MAG TPA: DUF1874 domain-containing protein [Polyangiaceae bacterium]|nr:DUF1874 domain-containing protein [Polyangiaceae bacterium]